MNQPQVSVRRAELTDLPVIKSIYNEGIRDRIATLDTEEKNDVTITAWFSQHNDRYKILVACRSSTVVAWASLNRYSMRSAYDGVADISIYVAPSDRGLGVGSILLRALEEEARASGFYKLVLFTFPTNAAGQRLYKRCGFREVGVFRGQGRLNNAFVDVMAMEKHFAPELL